MSDSPRPPSPRPSPGPDPSDGRDDRPASESQIRYPADTGPSDADMLERVLTGRVGASNATDIEQKLITLLGLLDTPIAPAPDAPTSSELADVVLARIGQWERAQDSEEIDPNAPALSKADAQALDAWTLNRYDPEAVPESLRQRARNHQALADLVTASDVTISPEQRDRSMRATLEQIESQGERAKWQIGPESPVEDRRFRFRLHEVASLAAAILLAAGIGFPLVGELRHASRKMHTAGDFRQIGGAFDTYAGDFQNTLPVFSNRTTTAGTTESGVQSAGMPVIDHTWWDIGGDPTKSNSANLYTLARLDYLSLEDLTSPGNPLAPSEADALENDWASPEQVSYTYRVVRRRTNGLGPTKQFQNPAAVVLLTDKSPIQITVSEDGTRRAEVDLSASSPNWGDRGGQYILRADNSVSWSLDPWDEGPAGGRDYFWVPAGIQAEIKSIIAGGMPSASPFTGSELPDNPEDAFGGP